MRLTLRTLLAYLDDTLEPAQAKLIGQKVAESDQARELIERIQTVTRRRRITTPPDGGPGGALDPNTLGEYLDNEVAPEQAAEVEEICLASDTHLAEVAACHQILSLILGEPALVPPTARQRMYGLVKGPEAIPFRRPPATGPRADADIPQGRDVDDTLRLGMPPISGRDRGNPWPLILGGAVAASVLLVAVWQMLKNPEPAAVDPNKVNTPVVAQVDPNKDKAVSEPDKDKTPEKKNVAEIKPDDKKVDEPGELKLPPVVLDVAWTPASPAVQAIGQLVDDPKEKQPRVLFAYTSGKDWQRVGPKNPEVKSATPLVSLPACKSVVQTEKGVTLTLAGNIFPELFDVFPLYESRVELHANDGFDLDLTLRRGRIRVRAGDRPARLLVRFENPTQPDQNEFFDIALQSPGTEIILDRWFNLPREKFYRNAKDTNRVGPSAEMACVVVSGSVMFKHHGRHHALAAPPGSALISWSSLKGLYQPVDLKALPPGLTSLPPLPQGPEAKARADILRAREDLSQRLSTKAVDVGLAEALKSPDPAVRRLAVFSFAAIDDVSTVVEQLEQETGPELRAWGVEALRHWLAAGRDHDYKLFDLLKAKYRTAEAEIILNLLHDPSETDVKSPDTYDLLINYLNHPQLAVRELAAWNLYQLVPAARDKIRFNAAADPATRQQVQASWRALLPGSPPPKK